MAGSVRFTALNAVNANGDGPAFELFSPRYVWSMQVILNGAPTGAKVELKASFDGGTTYGTILTWDIADGKASGDIVSVEGVSANNVRATLSGLTGGSSPTVTAIVNAEPN